MQTQDTPSKRIKLLRSEIIRTVPRFPNDKASKANLEQSSLGTLLVIYMSWLSRLVFTSPRVATVRQRALEDPRWPALHGSINFLLDKVRRGEDLTPHLSLAALFEGYTPPRVRATSAERWADKDFLLNVMGFHHFHLGMTMEPKGFMTRTDVVLFARVTRTTFEALGLFDHSVFEGHDQTTMAAERQRLWRLRDEVLYEGVPPGTFMIGGMISTSGHSTQIVFLAQKYARLIANIDPHLDDRRYLERELYRDLVEAPAKPKLRWAFKHLDLYLVDDATETAFLCHRGQF